MFDRSALLLLALAAMLTMTAGTGSAHDKKYPDWKGEWDAVVPRTPGQQLRFDPTKLYGRRQEAPLKEEYLKVYQENLEEQARGGQGLFLDHASCLPAGMPTMMSIGRFEYIITPDTTYVATGSDLRRIFTDGRPWPAEGGAVGPPAAIVSAVNDALRGLGVELCDLPLSPDRVLAAIDAARQSAGS
jgi:hypothetical protein